MAHDMGSVYLALSFVLLIPLPALVILSGWRKAILFAVPIWVLACLLVDRAAYFLMYAVLLSPYFVWTCRTMYRLFKRP